MIRRLTALAILLATLAFGAVAVRWADGEFERTHPPWDPSETISRPDWVWKIYRPYQHLENAWPWASVAITFGMGAIVALDGRKAMSRPGSVVVVVACLVAGASIAHFLLAAPPLFRTNGISEGLGNMLVVRVPGAILGTWAVTWGRKGDWRGRLVGWVWMANIGFLVAFAVLFG